MSSATLSTAAKPSLNNQTLRYVPGRITIKRSWHESNDILGRLIAINRSRAHFQKFETTFLQKKNDVLTRVSLLR
jgi:hypothetical protein